MKKICVCILIMLAISSEALASLHNYDTISPINLTIDSFEQMSPESRELFTRALHHFARVSTNPEEFTFTNDLVLRKMSEDIQPMQNPWSEHNMLGNFGGIPISPSNLHDPEPQDTRWLHSFTIANENETPLTRQSILPMELAPTIISSPFYLDSRFGAFIANPN